MEAACVSAKAINTEYHASVMYQIYRLNWEASESVDLVVNTSNTDTDK